MNAVPILIGNLDDEHSHNARLKHFSERGIKPLTAWGYNGVNLALQPLSPHEVDGKGVKTFVEPRQVGDVLSYIAAIHTGIETGKDFIVFTQDAELEQGFVPEWTAIESEIPADVGCVQIDSIDHDGMRSYGVHSTHFSRRRYPFGFSAIWWRNVRAKVAVNMLTPVCSPVDVLLMRRVYPSLGHTTSIKRLSRKA